MSIRKRKDSGRWQARFAGLDGKVHSRDFDLKADAQRWEREQMRSVEKGEWVSPTAGKITVDGVYQQWIQTRIEIKASTKLGYERIYARYIQDKWGSVRVTNVTPQGVQEWIVGLTGKKGQPLGSSPKRQAHQVLSMILDQAMRNGQITRNPARYDAIGKIEYLPPVRLMEQHRYLSYTQLCEIAKDCGHYEALIMLLGTTGLRWGEATAITIADIDWLRRRVDVNKAHVELSGPVSIDTPKNGKSRKVGLMPPVLALLSELAAGKDDSDLLFTNAAGTALRSPNFFRKVWQPARTRVGQSGLRIHDLRHTAASLAVDAGANIKAVQQMLGHASAQMTLDRYAGLFDDHLDDVLDRMEQQFLKAKSDSEVTERPVVVSLKAKGKGKPFDKNNYLVAPGRIELPAKGLGNLCSIP